MTLSEAVRRYAAALVGYRHSQGQPFPVCLRLVDVGAPQPLLVHPTNPFSDDALTFLPNTKFWYSVNSRPGAWVIAGIRSGVTRLEVLARLHSPEMDRVLEVFPAAPGDAFLIPRGRIHSLGTGALLWELQERPAVPLRIAAFRPEDQVSRREAQAGLSVVQFQDRQLSRISHEAGKGLQTRRVPLVHHCPQFIVDELRLFDHLFDRTTGESCHLLALIRGTVEIHTGAGVETLQQGAVACIPARLGDYRMYTLTDTATILRVIPQKMR